MWILIVATSWRSWRKKGQNVGSALSIAVSCMWFSISLLCLCSRYIILLRPQSPSHIKYDTSDRAQGNISAFVCFYVILCFKACSHVGLGQTPFIVICIFFFICFVLKSIILLGIMLAPDHIVTFKEFSLEKIFKLNGVLCSSSLKILNMGMNC